MIKFNDSGSKSFTQLTKNIAGTGRSIGILIDGKLITSPTVDSGYKATGITGGSAVIIGDFTAITAANLSAQLRSGALPVPVEVIKTDRY